MLFFLDAIASQEIISHKGYFLTHSLNSHVTELKSSSSSIISTISTNWKNSIRVTSATNSTNCYCFVFPFVFHYWNIFAGSEKGLIYQEFFLKTIVNEKLAYISIQNKHLAFRFVKQMRIWPNTVPLNLLFQPSLNRGDSIKKSTNFQK